LHDGRRAKFTGKKHVTVGEPNNFTKIKNCSKALNCTINDLFTSALSQALARFFKEHGDASTKEINIILPANIRWELYPTREAVKLENKFAPCQMRLPIVEDPQESLKAVKKETAKLKRQFPAIYFMYITGKTMSVFLADFISRVVTDKLSMPYTLAFSNTPGVLKEIVVQNTLI
jgi:NRPS condensation-like uncharacterized protein